MAELAVGSLACHCARTHPPPRRVVLTGGPGAGKTAVLEMARHALSRGWVSGDDRRGRPAWSRPERDRRRRAEGARGPGLAGTEDEFPTDVLEPEDVVAARRRTELIAAALGALDPIHREAVILIAVSHLVCRRSLVAHAGDGPCRREHDGSGGSQAAAAGTRTPVYRVRVVMRDAWSCRTFRCHAARMFATPRRRASVWGEPGAAGARCRGASGRRAARSRAEPS